MKINASSSLNRIKKLNKTINVSKTKPSYNQKSDNRYIVPKTHITFNQNSVSIPYNEILGDLMQYLENKIKPNLYQEINNYISTKLKTYKEPKLNKNNNNITKTCQSPGIKNKIQSNLNHLNLNTSITSERKSLNKRKKNMCSLKLTNDFLYKKIGSIYKRKNQGKSIKNINNERYSNINKNNFDQFSINSLEHKNIINYVNDKLDNVDYNSSINSNTRNDLVSINLYKKLKPRTKKINIFKDNTNIEMKLRKKRVKNDRYKINLSQFKSKNDSKEKSREKDFVVININNNSCNNMSSKSNANMYSNISNINNFRRKLNNNFTRNNTVNSSTHKRSKIANVKKYNLSKKYMNEKLLYKLSLNLLNNINNSHNNIDELNDYRTINLMESKTNRNCNINKNGICESLLLNSKNKIKSFYNINNSTNCNNGKVSYTNFIKMIDLKKKINNNKINTVNLKEKNKFIKNSTEKLETIKINSGRKTGQKTEKLFMQNKKLDKNKFWKVVNKDKKVSDKYIHINSKEVNKIIKNDIKNEEDIKKTEYMIQPDNNTFNDEELMKKIKNNLDDNLRVMLNFSYENFLSKESENDSTIEIV